ncbi:MAG: hypothetical protein ABI772_14695 [Bacteroidota bacterium]
MKSPSILFLLLLIILKPAIGQWNQLTTNSGYNNCIERISSSKIWAGTGSGIYESTDEGQTWHNTHITNHNVGSILHFNDTIIISYSLFITTTSGKWENYSMTSYNDGVNFSAPSLITNNNASGNAYLYKAHGTLIAASGNKYYISANYGNVWSAFVSPNTNTPRFLFARNNRVIYQDYGNNTGYSSLLMSDDGMNTWTTIDSSKMFVSFYFNDSILMYTATILDSVGGNPVIYNTTYRSTNSGNTWDSLFTGPLNLSLFFETFVDNDIYLFTNDFPTSYIYVSHDAGATWQQDSWGGPYVNGKVFLPTDEVLSNNGDYLMITSLNQVYHYFPSENSLYPSSTGMSGIWPKQIKIDHNRICTGGDQFEGISISDDAGSTWRRSPFPYQLVDMVVHGDTILWTSMNYYQYLIRSFNGGFTWDTLIIPSSTSSNLYIEEINGRVYNGPNPLQYSSDWGSTWTTLQASPANGPFAAHNDTLYITKSNGASYRYNETNDTWTALGGGWINGAGTIGQLSFLSNAIVNINRCGMRKSYDNGATWLTPALNGLYITNCYFLPRNIVEYKGLWLISMGPDGIYKSADGGENW